MSDLTQLVPKTGLLAWHKYDAATSTNGNINDASGNGRHLVQATTPPLLTADAWKGQQGWYFNGSANPLNVTTSVTPKHVVVIAALEETVFTSYRGLLSGIISGDWLTTDNTGNKFFTFGTPYDYRKSDVDFTDYNWQAPIGLKPEVIEIMYPSTGIPMDGIQVGQQKADTSRKFKGYFFEQMLYSNVLSTDERILLAEYAALKYKIFRKIATGIEVWPFNPDWSRGLSADKLVLTSTSVNGAIKARAKSQAKSGIEAGFTARWAEEYDAAFAFWNAKYPGTSFIYRDYGFSPPRDIQAKFVTGLSMKQDDYHAINYGWQAMSEDVSDSWDGGTPGDGASAFEDGGTV